MQDHKDGENKDILKKKNNNKQLYHRFLTLWDQIKTHYLAKQTNNNQLLIYQLLVLVVFKLTKFQAKIKCSVLEILFHNKLI